MLSGILDILDREFKDVNRKQELNGPYGKNTDKLWGRQHQLRTIKMQMDELVDFALLAELDGDGLWN